MDKSVEHIIGEYVRGKISAENRTWLEQAMQANAQLAAQVQALQTNYAIERYLSGQMEESERTTFEEQLSNDTDLQEKVKAEKAAQQFLQTARRMELHKALEKAAQKSQERKVRRQRLRRRFLFTILFIAVALVVWQIIPFTRNEHEPHQQDQSSISDTASLKQIAQDTLVRDTMQPTKQTNPKRKTAVSKKNALIIAMLDDYDQEKLDLPAIRGDATVSDWQIDYQNGNYELVITTLNPMIDNELPKNDTARLALGLAYYYHTAPDYNKAIAQFDILIKKNSIFIEEARWFKAVALLRQGRTQEAVSILRAITQEEDVAFNQRKANELLAQLLRN